MRLAVATDDGEHVAAHTGRCRGVVVFEVHESTARRIEERSSGFPLHARGECHGREGAGRDEHDGSQETPAEPQDAQGGNRGCGHRNPQGENRHSHAGLIEALDGCTVLITRGLGPRLVADLRQHGIDPFVSQVARVDEAASSFALGLLARAQGSGCARHA